MDAASGAFEALGAAADVATAALEWETPNDAVEGAELIIEGCIGARGGRGEEPALEGRAAAGGGGWGGGAGEGVASMDESIAAEMEGSHE
jgi:hypothetical protein